MGSAVRFLSNGIGLHGINWRTGNIQLNATDSWGSPSVDEAVTSDIATGTVDAVSGNGVKDTSLMSGYADYALAGKFLRMTSGTDDGVTWKIAYNAGDHIFLDTTSVTNIASTDTFVIFGDKIAATYNSAGDVYRYMRISIDQQHTADDYYQIGFGAPCQVITLSKGWSPQFNKDHQYDINMLRSRSGAMIPSKGADKKRIYKVTFRAASTTERNEIISAIDYIEGRNITLIQDDSDMNNCHLVKHISTKIDQANRFLGTRYDLNSIVFEEVL
jgi:hypothetical protein